MKEEILTELYDQSTATELISEMTEKLNEKSQTYKSDTDTQETAYEEPQMSNVDTNNQENTNEEPQMSNVDTDNQENTNEESRMSNVDTDNQENTNEESRISELNTKINSLTQELESYKAAKKQQEKIAEQLNEFYELFPNIAIKAIPDEVWENVKSGNTLAASYAVYERRISEAARRIEEINKRNASLAAGVAGKNSSDEFFSIDEVKKMSPSEVRSNFAKIRKSMEVWN